MSTRLETTPQLLGLSHDHRTNRWRVTCPKCGNVFDPPTTMLATQRLECQKRRCGAEMTADYNAQPPTVSHQPL